MSQSVPILRKVTTKISLFPDFKVVIYHSWSAEGLETSPVFNSLQQPSLRNSKVSPNIYVAYRLNCVLESMLELKRRRKVNSDCWKRR